MKCAVRCALNVGHIPCGTKIHKGIRHGFKAILTHDLSVIRNYGKEAATLMFMRSIEKHNLKYTTYVGDGDSSSYGVVSEALSKEYGSSYLVSKEDSVCHIQKQMGTNLRRLKLEAKGRTLAGGRRRLTDSVIDSFQNYFGNAIRNNSNNLTAMYNTFWAIYFHCIAGENESLSEQQAFS